MGKKDIQQGEDRNRGCCRKCLGILQCCHLPASSGVKIVSIVSILIGLVFCCLGVWLNVVVATNNNELAPRNQVVYELNQPASSSKSTVTTSSSSGQLALSVHNTVVGAGDLDTISTQSSLFDTSSVYLTAPSSSSQSGAPGGSGSSWPLSSISMGKGPSGRKPAVLSNHLGPKRIIPLANFHNYLICLGILSICVGFVRTLASIFLLWNSVEKCDAIRSCVNCLSSACTYIVQSCKAICVSPGYTTSEEMCLSFEGPMTISEVTNVCDPIDPTYVASCSPCPQTNSTSEWWLFVAGTVCVIGLGLGIVRYLNYRRHPRWLRLCQIVAASFDILHFLVRCLWNWGLVSLPFMTRRQPVIVPAGPNAVDPTPQPSISEAEEEFWTASEEEMEPQGWEYPMTDDEDD